MANLHPRSFAEFRESVYKEINPEDTYEDITKKMGRIRMDLGWISRISTLSSAREAIWGNGGPSARTLMAIDSFSREGGGWHLRVIEDNEYSITRFDSPSNLIGAVVKTGDEELAVRTFETVANRYRESEQFKFVPSGLGQWAVALSRVSNEEQSRRLMNSLDNLRFSWQHIDSEDTDELHPVSFLIDIPGTSMEMRLRLLELAQQDAATTKNKGWAWSEQLKNTMGQLAARKDDELRYKARRELGVAESDEEFMSHQKATKARMTERLRSERERRIGREEKLNAIENDRVLNLVKEAFNSN